MRPPALEIRLILSAPGMGWEYIARQRGEVIAASEGDGYPDMGRALVACAAEIKAALAYRKEHREAGEAAENGE